MSDYPAFWLVSFHDDAVDVVLDPSNVSRRCWLHQEGVEALRVEFASTAAQVTLGSSQSADIYLPDDGGGSISDVHCSFSCENQTGAIVLTDHSPGLTQVFDTDDDLVIPISEAQNSVVVSKSFNRGVSIGPYRFRLLWESDVVNRYLASDTSLLALGPWGAKGDRHRYIQGEVIGMGACGHVWKAVDLRDGKALAVKRFFTLEGKRHEFARREVRSMIKIQNSKHIGHEHILNIFHVEYDCRERWIEMFMPLKEGSVKSLVGQLDHSPLLSLAVARGVYRQMLKALCCIAQHGIIHRDLKPDNILYESRYDDEGVVGYHFYLADFGLSHEAAETCTTRVGTEAFMAPEVLSKGRQTTKMDIWSLFATIVWILDAGKFRTQLRSRRIANIVKRLVEIASMPQLEKIRRMAEIHPDRRPSSQELLVASELAISLKLPDTFDDTAVCFLGLSNAHELGGTPSDPHGAQDTISDPSLQSRSFSSDASVSTLPSIATPDSTPPMERLSDCFHTDINSFLPPKGELHAFSMINMPITRRDKDKREMGSECSSTTMATDPATNGWECLPLTLE